MERLIIIDEMKPKPKLDEILDMTPGKRIDRILGDTIPESVNDYYAQAIQARNNKRQKRLTDITLKDKLEILLKSIDTSSFNEPESKAHNKILDRYRVTSKEKKID